MNTEFIHSTMQRNSALISVDY